MKKPAKLSSGLQTATRRSGPFNPVGGIRKQSQLLQVLRWMILKQSLLSARPPNWRISGLRENIVVCQARRVHLSGLSLCTGPMCQAKRLLRTGRRNSRHPRRGNPSPCSARHPSR